MGGSHRRTRDRRRLLLLVLEGRLYEIALCCRRTKGTDRRAATGHMVQLEDSEGGIGASHSIAKYENGNGLLEKSYLITTFTFMQLQSSNPAFRKK